MPDNAEERRAAAAVPIGPGVTPNVDKDADWRAQVAGGIRGVSVESTNSDVGAATSPVHSAAHSPVLSTTSPHPALFGGA